MLNAFSIGILLLLLGALTTCLSVRYTEPHTPCDLFVPFVSGLIMAAAGLLLCIGSFLVWGCQNLP